MYSCEVNMMDIRPLTSAAPSPLSLTHNPNLRTYHSAYVHPSSTNMVVDAPVDNGNPSMPVSPKQGETITADTLGKPDSNISSSWASQVSQKTASSPSSPSLSALTSKENMEKSEINLQSSTSMNDSESPSQKFTEDKEMEGDEVSELTASDMAGRNNDSQERSPSQENSSFEDSERGGVAGSNMQGREPFASRGTPTNLDASFERRSRRKPTIEDIVRRVRPVEESPYDSEESEIEDEIIQEEMLRRMKASEVDEVDGSAKGSMRIMDLVDGDEERFPVGPYRQFGLSRMEGTEDIPDDDEDTSADGSIDADKNAFLKDVPQHIYDLMHEVKVNAHAMFNKTANCLPPAEAKTRREQYLLQLLSNLRDRCIDDGLRPEVIGAILKDVEMEVTLLHEDLEELKRYNSEIDKSSDLSFNSFPQQHFLSKPESKGNLDSSVSGNSDSKTKLTSDSPFLSSSNPLSFLNPTGDSSVPSSAQPSSTSSTSPITTSSPQRSLASPSSGQKSDTKPTIITVSANIPPVGMNGDLKPPPPLISSNASGLPHLHPLSSSENAFSPNLFNNGKLGPWFPGGLPNMPLYPFSPGSPLDHALARRFLHEGKIGENVDKDYLKCQFCERTFRRQKNLENHVENTHQGKGPLKPRRETNDMYFKCSHCPYTTKHQSNLYVHLRIHTGERPYICGACGVQYSQSHSLKSHIINKHDGIMSYYIKEKRTRSPRGMGYLTTQVMQDNNIFKLPPPPLLGPGLPTSNLDLVTKAIEMAKSEHAQHQQQLQQQHMSPKMQEHMRNLSLPPLTPTNGNSNNNRGSTPNNSSSGNTRDLSTSQASSKSPSTPNVTTTSSSSLSNPSMIPSSGAPSIPPPHFFMSGPQMSPLMFGELPPHIRNPGHMGPGGPHHNAPPHLFPGFPAFPPHSSAGFHGGLSPLSGLSPNSSSNMPPQSPHQNQVPPHLQMQGNMPHSMNTPPLPMLPHQIKKEPRPPSTPSTPVAGMKRPRSESPVARQPSSLGDGAIDLRKKSPPPLEQHAHDLSTCGDKENCAHAAKLKYLRLNVVRMLGILVPNLNFAEKGISAESESVDELLQDVIESNTHDDEMVE